MNEATHIIITVHGIRTFGGWQNLLRGLLTAARPGCRVVAYNYGYFSALAFMIPPLRSLLVRRFQNALSNIAADNPNARIDIVAHSFGTHIVGWSLWHLRGRLRIDTLILAGSVLRSEFNWSDILRANTVGRIINDCGTNDVALLASQLFVLFTGMAGRVGFAGMLSDRLQNRFFRGGHGLYFQAIDSAGTSFMRRYWLPLLTASEPVESIDQRSSPGVIAGILQVVTTNMEPIKLLTYGALLLTPALYYYRVSDQLRNDKQQLIKQQSALLFNAARMQTEAGANAAARASLQQLAQTGVTADSSNLAAEILRTELRRRELPLVVEMPFYTQASTCLDFSPDGDKGYRVSELEVRDAAPVTVGFLRLNLKATVARDLDYADDDKWMEIGPDKCSAYGRRFSNNGRRFLALGSSIRVMEIGAAAAVTVADIPGPYKDAGFGITDDVVLVNRIDRVEAFAYTLRRRLGSLHERIDDIWTEGQRIYLRGAAAQWVCSSTLRSCSEDVVQTADYPLNLAPVRRTLAAARTEVDPVCRLSGTDKGFQFSSGLVLYQQDQTLKAIDLAGQQTIGRHDSDRSTEIFACDANRCEPSWSATSSGFLADSRSGIVYSAENGLVIRGVQTGTFLGRITAASSDFVTLRRTGTGHLLADYSFKCANGAGSVRLYQIAPSPVISSIKVVGFGLDQAGIPMIQTADGKVSLGADSRLLANAGGFESPGFPLARAGDNLIGSGAGYVYQWSLARRAPRCQTKLDTEDEPQALRLDPSGRLLIAQESFPTGGGSSQIIDISSCKVIANVPGATRWADLGRSIVSADTTVQNGTGLVFVDVYKWPFSQQTQEYVIPGHRERGGGGVAGELVLAVGNTNLNPLMDESDLLVLPEGTSDESAQDNSDPDGGKELSSDTVVVELSTGDPVCRAPRGVRSAWRIDQGLLALGQKRDILLAKVDDNECQVLSRIETHRGQVIWVGADLPRRRLLSLDDQNDFQVWQF